MKFANVMKVMLGAAILSGLAGCSDAPTDRDAKRALRKVTGNCKYFTITHVLKVNWALPGSPAYQVDLQYTIEAAPLPEAKNVTAPLMASLTALNAQLDAAATERDQNFKTNADFLDRIERAQKAGDETLALSTERQRSAFIRQQMEPSLKLARELAEQKGVAIRHGTEPLREDFFKTCPNTTPAVFEKIYDNAGIVPYVEGRTVDFATSLRMVKAEKGWAAGG
jgi:hypothetical protein